MTRQRNRRPRATHCLADPFVHKPPQRHIVPSPWCVAVTRELRHHSYCGVPVLRRCSAARHLCIPDSPSIRATRLAPIAAVVRICPPGNDTQLRCGAADGREPAQVRAPGRVHSMDTGCVRDDVWLLRGVCFFEGQLLCQAPIMTVQRRQSAQAHACWTSARSLGCRGSPQHRRFARRAHFAHSCGRCCRHRRALLTRATPPSRDAHPHPPHTCRTHRPVNAPHTPNTLHHR